MRGLETDHVISGPMRGLKNVWGSDIRQTYRQTEIQTDRHVNSMTDPALRAESVKNAILIPIVGPIQ